MILKISDPATAMAMAMVTATAMVMVTEHTDVVIMKKRMVSVKRENRKKIEINFDNMLFVMKRFRLIKISQPLFLFKAISYYQYVNLVPLYKLLIDYYTVKLVLYSPFSPHTNVS